jgi:hypothetical protein
MNIKRNLIAASVLAIGLAGAVPAMAETDTTVTVTKTGHHTSTTAITRSISRRTARRTIGKTMAPWTSGRELPSDRRTYVTTGGVRMELNTERPYERHDWSRQALRDKHDGDEMRERDDD